MALSAVIWEPQGDNHEAFDIGFAEVDESSSIYIDLRPSRRAQPFCNPGGSDYTLAHNTQVGDTLVIFRCFTFLEFSCPRQSWRQWEAKSGLKKIPVSDKVTSSS